MDYCCVVGCATHSQKDGVEGNKEARLLEGWIRGLCAVPVRCSAGSAV